MTKDQFTKATKLAMDPKVELINEELSHFDGFGLPDFKRVFCTIRQVARLIRWQCQYMNGDWDWEELSSIRNLSRRRFEIAE